MRFALLLLLVAMGAAGSASAQDRYVDSGLGNDINPGTLAEPWQTIQHAIDNVGPGMTILVRGGVYGEAVTFEGAVDSGSAAGGHVILSAFGDETVVLDGSGLIPVDRQGLVTIRDASYVRVVGFELRNFTTTDAGRAPCGLHIEGTSHHIDFVANDIHHIAQNNPSDGGAHGVSVYGTSAVEAVHDLFIDGNTVHDCKLMFSEAFVLNGNVRDFVVSNNLVRDCDNIGYDFIGYEGECATCTRDFGDNVDRARDGLVRGNEARGIDTVDNPAYVGERSAAGFYVDGGANIVFEGNVSRENNLGFELASEHFGKATEGVTIRNNLIHDCLVAGVATGGYSAGEGPGGGVARNNVVVNNTLYRNTMSDRAEDDWGAEILLQNRNEGNVYKNNLVHARTGRPRVAIVGLLNTGNVWGNQLYFGSAEGTTPGGVSFDDPLLSNPLGGGFQLATGSPAVDAGETLPASLIGVVDFDGVERVTGVSVDIGALESSAVATVPFGVSPLAPTLRAWPNPLHDQTRLSFDLPGDGDVTIRVYDVAGRRVGEVMDDHRPAGGYEAVWNAVDPGGRPLPSGVYFIRLSSGALSVTRKAFVVR